MAVAGTPTSTLEHLVMANTADVLSLILVRHAAAEDRGTRWPDDAVRPLTTRGAARFKAVAKGLVRLEGAPGQIFTSPLVRAMQTADILSRVANDEAPPHTIEALTPGVEPARVFAAIKKRATASTIAIIGHEPDLSRLAAYLTDASAFPPFKKGGMCRIDVPTGQRGEGAHCVWFAPPRVLRRLR